MSLDTLETRAALATADTRLGIARAVLNKIERETRNAASLQGLNDVVTRLLATYYQADADYSKLARQAVAERSRL